MSEYGIQWSAPEMTTVNGVAKMVSTGEPTLEFWDAWKGNKANVRAQGISCAKDKQTGRFVAKKWMDAHGAPSPGTDRQASMEAMQPQSGISDDTMRQVNPAHVPPDAPGTPYHAQQNQPHVQKVRSAQAQHDVFNNPNEPYYKCMSMQARLVHKLRMACIDAEEQGMSNRNIAEVLSHYANEYIVKG